MDTGSATLAVPLKECTNCVEHDHRLDLSTAKGTAGFIECSSPLCKTGSCHEISACTTCSAKSHACCSNIAPDACGFYLRYADKSGASGALVQADVGIADLTVPLAFGAILKETEKFENNNIDGIFGLAYPELACNPTCVSPLFDTLVSSEKVEKDIFSICTGPEGGILSLGGSNPDHYEGDLQYVPMVHSGAKKFYSVNVKHVLVGGEKISLPDLGSAVIDSGTTLIVLSRESYDTLKSHFQANYCDVPGLCTSKVQLQNETRVVRGEVLEDNTLNISTTNRKEQHSWFEPGYCVTLSDAYVDLLPPITIRFDKDVELTLEPEEYMLKYKVSSSLSWDKMYRCLGLGFLDGMDKIENDAIFGNTLLQKYLVEYDRENDRLGFAEAKDCRDPKIEAFGSGQAPVPSERGILPSWILKLLTYGSIIAWVIVIGLCVVENQKRRSGYESIPQT